MFSAFSTQEVPKLFKSKVVIITGSSSGFGAAVAVRFASEGASGIILHGRNEEALNKVKQECESASRGSTKVHICIGDITEDVVRQNIVNSAIENFGQLDILINNAGIGMRGRLSDVSMADYDKVFNVNVRSLIAITQIALPHLIKSKGNIVNISSVAAVKANGMAPFYCCSKAAVDHFTKCMAIDLGPQGVRVNSVNPGLVLETSFNDRMGEIPEELKKRLTEGAPLKRTATIEEITDAILFISSDRASFMTGVIFLVDGGLTQA